MEGQTPLVECLYSVVDQNDIILTPLREGGMDQESERERKSERKGERGKKGESGRMRGSENMKCERERGR